MLGGTQIGCGSTALATMTIVGGRWSPTVIATLSGGELRHSDLLAELPGVSKKVLTETLRRLERDGLVRREHYAERPPRSRYALTPLGVEAAALVETIGVWGTAHLGRIEEARAEYDTA